MKDYYKILEVDAEASQEIIEKSYKVLAKKYHPDVEHTGDAKYAEEKFKEISEAYDILCSPDKRNTYDIKFNEYKENIKKQNFVSMQDYKKLVDYCSKLENQINSISSTTSNSTANNNSQSSQNFESLRQDAILRGQQEAFRKAQHDAYINNLKNMGYKIRYKKTIKEQIKNFIALLITILILGIISFILWQIPFIREKLIKTFSFSSIL